MYCEGGGETVELDILFLFLCLCLDVFGMVYRDGYRDVNRLLYLEENIII